MTSPALVVLFLALACSIFGTALESTHDHDAKRTSVMTAIMRNHDIMHDQRNNLINNQRTKTDTKLKINNEIYTATAEMRHFKVNDRFKKVENIGLRVKRQETYDQCEPFLWTKGKESISHPQLRNSRNGFYSNSTDCVTNINATEGFVIELTFVDKFHLEGHQDCAYDYLEIHDGMYGYAHLRGKFCGEAFPNKITSSGPYLWLKFHSDDTIEYEGFQIDIKFISSPASYKIPDSCYIDKDGPYGQIEYPANIPADCNSKEHALDVLWKIKTPENTKIYLNFSQYQLALTNDCENNVVQVFGSVLEFPAKLAHYCGSMANSVTTLNDQGNIMYVRLFAAQHAKAASLNATYTAYRTVDPSKDERCRSDELDCEDNTCIAQNLGCDGYAHCRLKADEDPDNCRKATESILDQVHIRVILIIFSLILSGMSFIFLFKCIRKLYQDHKIIKEHIKQSCEDRLDSLVSSRLTLDPKRLQRDSEPRASLERENHTNEMFKRQRNYSQNKPSSIDSDFIQETQIDLDDDESWRRAGATLPPETEEVRIERNGRRRSDLSKIEEGVRKEARGRSEEKKVKERKENRDASVGAPDTRESGCQTRESLFQAATSPDGTESGSGSGRGFSTFGYSGATLARPSPPANTSEITIELIKPTRQESQTKKLPDRRPMSSETTRSAPDVIIVSKPVR